MLKIYDTKLREKVPFESLEHGKIGMYVCGPTVYNYIHIGNARTFVSFDVIRRYLSWRGFDVKFVSNITDVDDKIIKKANEEGRSAAEVAAEYSQAFLDDMHAMNVQDPDVRPRATEEIPEMINSSRSSSTAAMRMRSKAMSTSACAATLITARCPVATSTRWKAAIASCAPTGQGLEDRKRDHLDFALWKAAKPGEPSWESPWGQGRPGWHIECSAMSRKYLGLPFDIHGGGADLVFPHHENERAQSEAACGCTFANHWMHSGMLQINHEKMSKSLGNFLLLRDILKTTSPDVLRFLMLQTHYRSPLDFSDERLDEAASALSRIENAVRNLDWQMKNAQDVPSPLDTQAILKQAKSTRVEFVLAMDDDFNAPRALGEVFDLVGFANTQIADKTLSLSDVPAVRDLRETITTLMRVFGVEVAPQDWEDAQDDAYPAEVVDLAKQVAGYEGSDAHEAVDALLDARATARAEKNWAVADAVRDGLTGLGFTIEDTPQGARVSYDPSEGK